jgi:hypothetical protein
MHTVEISFAVLSKAQKAQALKLHPRATRWDRFEIDRSGTVLRLKQRTS